MSAAGPYSMKRGIPGPGEKPCLKYCRVFFLSIMLSLLFVCSALARPGAAGAEISVEITGDGVAAPTVISQVYLEAMPQVQSTYSTINTWPTKKFYAARGVRLADLLTAAGIKDEARTIIITSSDGFKMTFTRKELLEDARYYYPGLKDNHEYYGYIPGSPDGAVEVDAILALASVEGSDDFSLMDGSDAPLLVMGQRWVTEQTNNVFIKYVSSIEVSTAAPAKWESPAAAPGGGTFADGTQVALSTSDMDGDNIHYTTDGSDPTYESPMYNWIKKRWWSTRSDELADINHPIDVTGSMTIKAVAIGFGKEDSDIVSFEYEVPLLTPPDLAADTDGNSVGRGVDVTFTDDAEWRGAINDVSVNGSSIAGRYVLAPGSITIDAGVFSAAGSYEVVVKAGGYYDAVAVQSMTSIVTLNSPSGGQEFKQGQTVPIRGTAEGVTVLNIKVAGPGGDIVYGPKDIVTDNGAFETGFSLSSSADTGTYTIIINCAELPAPVTGAFKCVSDTGGTVPEGDVVLTISGDGVSGTRKFTLEQLQAMDQYRQTYSAINTWPTKKWYAGEGVSLRDLLNSAGIKSSARQLKFTSEDGYTVKLTVRELLNDRRYYFPQFKDGSDAEGHIPGSPEGAVEVEPMLALVSAEGTDDAGYMNDLDALLLMMGQRAVTEQTGNLFVKKVNRIDVLTSTPAAWDKPEADPAGGVVEAGTLVRLSSKNMDDDKIYYTTDGSTPTVESPMYNWVASRWWSARGDDVVETINHPIEINKTTTIKAVTIGPGKKDSDVATFIYKVEEVPAAAGGAAGGSKLSVISYGSEAAIEIPPGAIPGEEVEVKIEKVAALPALPSGYKYGGGVYEFSIDGEYSYSFAESVTIKLRFDPDLAGEAEIPAIHYYDEAAGQWINTGGTVNGSTMSVQVDHFTKFAVLICDAAVLEPVQLQPVQPMQPPRAAASFADTVGHWAEESINRLHAMGAVSGYGDGSFKPDSPVSRAEFVAILVEAFHLEGQGGKVFNDTAGHWARDYIATASIYGIAGGYSDTMFGPDDFITREQMAVMACRAARIPFLNEETGFADRDSISGYARGAVAAAAGAKIMSGYPDHTFRPGGIATRAEAATVIVNALGEQ